MYYNNTAMHVQCIWVLKNVLIMYQVNETTLPASVLLVCHYTVTLQNLCHKDTIMHDIVLVLYTHWYPVDLSLLPTRGPCSKYELDIPEGQFRGKFEFSLTGPPLRVSTTESVHCIPYHTIVIKCK